MAPLTDGIIKGSGNSRFLKSVANALTLYPTHESLMEALAAGTLPIDLNGINPAGWETLGMALNKANLLSDDTATALGLTPAATPDNVLAKLIQLTQTLQTEKARAEVVSYVGTGTYGENNPNSLTFSFIPSVVIWIGRLYLQTGVLANEFSNSRSKVVMVQDVLQTSYKSSLGFAERTDYATPSGKKSEDGKTFYWYATPSASTPSPTYQLNDSQSKYYFLAIG